MVRASSVVARVIQHGFYARPAAPAAHLRPLATLARLGTIPRNSGSVRFVQGGVVKTFRCAAKQLVVPAHITPDELRDRIADELRDLKPDYRRWWDECRVDAFVASDGQHPRFVIAVDDDGVVYFDDHEDEFATGVLHDNVITTPGLHGELESAIFGMIHYPTH